MQLAVSLCHGQTIEFIGSTSSIFNQRVPVINDAGNVFYVYGSRYVIGNPTTPGLKTNSSVSTIAAPGPADPVPYVLSSNNTVTYITTTAFVQSNLSQNIVIAQGNAQAAGFGDPFIKYAQRTSPTSETGVFDYGIAPDDSISFRAEVSSNNFFGGYVAVYAGSPTSPTLLMDSFHAPPGLPGYTVDNNGYFHALRNRNGLSLFIGRVYNNSIGANGYAIWLHDAVNGIRLAHLASAGFGTPYPGDPSAVLSGTEFSIKHWPALADDGRYAFIAQSLFPTPRYGVFAGFENNLQPVATSGLAVPGFPGTYFTNFSGDAPIRMGTGGKCVFIATIAGTGITFGVNDRVAVIGSNPADLKILAHAGDQAPGMPAGAVWTSLVIDQSAKTENFLNYPINDQLVMFGNNRVAFVGQVAGGGVVTNPPAAANDSGIWVTDDSGNLTLLARRGTPIVTTAGSKASTNYFWLQGGSGRDGKPSGGNRVGQLAFANGTNTFRVTFAQPTALQLNQPVLVSGQVQLTFATQTGKTYYLQVTTNLASNTWSNVRTNIGDGSVQTNLVTQSGAQGYYRLLSN